MTVDTPQNPYHSYIVNAAAGAGKTWQLSRRFLFLVGAHAAAGEILTITFTRKAAAEMRSRIITLAAELAVDARAQQEFDRELHAYHREFADKRPQVRPPQRAQQVGNAVLSQSQKLKIATIDSVYSEWLSSLAAQGFAQIPLPFRIISDSDMIELQERSWQQLWRELPPSAQQTIQAKGVPRVKRIVAALQRFAPSQLQLRPLRTSSTTPASAATVAQLNADGEIYAALFTRWQKIYQNAKRAQGALDFQDLTILVQQLLAQDEGMLYYLQQRITHLLLDEFQDTSTSQWEIFHKISRELLAGENLVAAQRGLQATVFIVGDTKQSIYGFRGANAKIMREAAADLAIFAPRTRSLSTNYRSAAHLIAFFNTVFPALALEDFDTHRAAEGDQQIRDYGTITLAPLTTTEVEVEANYVAAHIAQTLQDEPHLKASDICILYRNATHADVFRTALLQRGIRSYRHEEQGFFNIQTSRDLLALCKWLALPADQQALLTVLRSPLANIPQTELLQACATAPQHGGDRSEQILVALAERYPQVVQALQAICARRHKTAPCQLLLYALHRLAALHVYRQHGEEFAGLQSQQVIVRFIDLIAEAEREGCSTLAALHVRLCALAHHNNVGNATIQTEAVTMMTIHKAKGLQFRYVVLVQAQEKWTKRDDYWVRSADGVAYSGTVKERPKAKDYRDLDTLYATNDMETAAESLRLLYVALTRAEHYLLVCGRTPKRSKQKGFLARIVSAVQNSNLPLEHENNAHGELLKLRGTAAPPPSSTRTKATPQAQLATTRLHQHSLQQEVSILLPHQHRLPQEQAPAAYTPAARIYGIYLHKALEQRVTGGEAVDHQYWQQLSRAAGIAADEELRQKAEQTLQRLLISPTWQQLWQNALWSKAEMPIVCLDEGKLINGIIDLLICYPQQRLMLIDYKTGTSHRELKHYRRQLNVYRLAVQKLYPDSHVTTALLFTADSKLVTFDN